MRVIGTAGHVDHGKSTLIAALTGTHPDRLKEEQEREMTIDLGFGWLTLPNDEELGIVDVPGHRDFIENMLAGVGGIDAALLVIAADEGIMPQTREHLAIIDLLQIPTGIIVLTKIDLISDPEWCDLVESDIRTTVAGTVFDSAPCVRVSARTGVGLDKLLQSISDILAEKPVRPDLGRPRLPIDRVFSMPGFGTVVTGTLLDGQLGIGDEIEILPINLKGRVRGLQTHKKKEERAIPGSRTAVNISGIETDQLKRGDVVAFPNQYQATNRLDARFRLLKDSSSPIKHGSEVKFFVGASETSAVVRLLGSEQLNPGEEGWIQLELREPVIAIRGDRYILRRPSPGETLGGGVIIDHQPKNRHKRFDQNILISLASLAQGSPSEVLLETALTLNAASIREVISRSRLESETAKLALQDLLETGQLIVLEEGRPAQQDDLLVIAAAKWNELKNKTMQIVNSYHINFPLRRGIPREELKSRLKLQARLFTAMLGKLIADSLLIESGSLVASVQHEIKFDNETQAKVRVLMDRFGQNPNSPPSFKECQAEVGEEVLRALIESGELVSISADVVFRKVDYESTVAKIIGTIQAKGQLTLAEVRDLFGTSRKYAQALMEHLDSAGVTMRDGDFRRLRR
jgi:selenocysteine-specific elongation factor